MTCGHDFWNERVRFGEMGSAGRFNLGMRRNWQTYARRIERNIESQRMLRVHIVCQVSRLEQTIGHCANITTKKRPFESSLHIFRDVLYTSRQLFRL